MRVPAVLAPMTNARRPYCCLSWSCAAERKKKQKRGGKINNERHIGKKYCARRSGHLFYIRACVYVCCLSWSFAAERKKQKREKKLTITEASVMKKCARRHACMLLIIRSWEKKTKDKKKLTITEETELILRGWDKTQKSVWMIHFFFTYTHTHAYTHIRANGLIS